MFVPFQLDSDLQHCQRSSTDRCLAAYVRNAFATMDAPVTYRIGICSLCTHPYSIFATSPLCQEYHLTDPSFSVIKRSSLPLLKCLFAKKIGSFPLFPWVEENPKDWNFLGACCLKQASLVWVIPLPDRILMKEFIDWKIQQALVRLLN